MKKLDHLNQPVSLCHQGTPLEILVLAQLASCFDNKTVSWTEWPDNSYDGRQGTDLFPLAEAILEQPLTIVNGELVVPNGPGLGINVNEVVIKRYPYRTGPCSVFQVNIKDRGHKMSLTEDCH